MDKNEKPAPMWKLWPQALIGLAVSMLILPVLAVFVSTGLVGERHMPLLALGAAFLGTLTGAFRAAKRASSVKLLAGLCCAGVIFMALFIVGCLASLRVAPSQLAPRLLLAALLGGTLGSVLSGYKPKKRRKNL